MEFHQIPGRSLGQGGGAACADREAGSTDKRNRGTAVNEKNDAKTDQSADQLPDRLSTDPKSPYYNADVLARDVGIRFKGVEKTNVEEYCVSEGWGAPPRIATVPRLPSRSMARSSRIFATRARPEAFRRCEEHLRRSNPILA